MKTYSGDRTIDGIVVLVDDRPLDGALSVETICDDGFEWGFEGPASSQLALALLVDHLGDPELAMRLHHVFMQQIVANFANEWVLTSTDIADAVTQLDQ
ncbi:MAG: DUF6166 domain-containing protein [Hyphomicrobiaceae bacterium]